MKFETTNMRRPPKRLSYTRHVYAPNPCVTGSALQSRTRLELFSFVEFWNSHLNVRGPREAPKPQKDQEKKPDIASAAPPGPPPPAPAPAPPTSASPQPDSAPPSDPDSLPHASQDPGSNLFHEFCPIKTRSPRELDCGSGQGALCFINPLFLQLESPLLRRRMFKRSLKVRVSTESSTLLSPPLAPPPPPPLMPKSKGKGKGLQQIRGKCKQTVRDQTGDIPSEPPPVAPHIRLEGGQSLTQALSQLPAIMEQVPENPDYMQPSPVISSSLPPSLSPYLSPSAPSTTPPAFPKAPVSLSPHASPRDSPSPSPYQSPSLSPKVLSSLSVHSSPNVSPSLSPYHFPSPSPLIAFSTSPCTSQSFPPVNTPPRMDQQGSHKENEEATAGVDSNDEGGDINGEGGQGLVSEMEAVSLKEAESCCSYSSQERAAEGGALPHNNGSQHMSQCH